MTPIESLRSHHDMADDCEGPECGFCKDLQALAAKDTEIAGLKREVQAYAESIDNVREVLGLDATHYLIIHDEVRERIKGLEGENHDLKAALVEARGETYPQPKQGWQCFHCGEWFTTRESARSHFGTSPDELPSASS